MNRRLKMYRTAPDGAKIIEHGKCITKTEYKELVEYASLKGIRLYSFKNFVGSIDTIKEVIDSICIVAADFPLLLDNGTHSVKLELEYIKGTEAEYASSIREVIRLNGIFYADIAFFEKDYLNALSEHKFVQNTTYKSVIYHELGHIVCHLYNLNSKQIGFDIAGFRFSKLSREYDEEMMNYLRTNLSIYSADSKESEIWKTANFDGTEIISEVFSAHYSKVSNEFAEKYFSKVYELTR